jgi:multicomponent Na+:H+ antiporter subunit E
VNRWAAILPRTAVRTVFVTALWLVVSEGDTNSLVVGIPLSVLAAAVSVRLYPDPVPRIDPLGFVRFAGFFVVNSILGGVDVAVRAFRPSLPLEPDNIIYRLRLEGLAARILFVNTVSLLPGTLSAQLRDGELLVHVLDCSRPVQEELRVVEDRIGDLFGLTLPLVAGDER